MTKSKLIIDKLAKLIEQGVISYKDLKSEILNMNNLEIILALGLIAHEEVL